MFFWQGFLILSAVAALFLLWPTLVVHLKKRKQELLDARSEIQQVVYDDQLKELEATHGRGEIEKKELDILKEDLHKTHIYEASQTADGEKPIVANWKSRIPVLSLALAVPLLALFIYFQVGAKQDWDIYELRRNFIENAESRAQVGAELIKALQNRLEKKPRNSHNWYLLGVTATDVGDYEEAVRAFRKLDELEPNSAVVLTELAQAHFRWAGTITPEVRGLIQRIMALQSDIPSVLGLAGIDAYQNARYQEAIDYWTQAVARINPHSAEYSALKSGIEQAREAMLAGGQSPREDAAQTASNVRIKVKVALADNVEASPDDVVFIYARAWQGPRIPLAIQKLTVADLPRTLTLDESMAMDPSRSLASASQVEIVARISQSGGVVPQPGDWQATLGPLVPSDKGPTHSMLIDKLVE